MHINLLEERSVSATAAQRAAVRLHGVSKSYGGRRVLADIDLDLRAGEFVAVVGRSGCGKSTLLRLLAGLEHADGGTLAAPAPDQTRMMFQEARLLPWKSVFDNVALGQARPVAPARAALDAVGLAQRVHEWPAVLSGGQRQRVALARALVSEPALLLLDEPLGALDALTRMEMQQLIESLWLQRGFTAVLVTHDVQEALALADRVLLIEDGRISLDLRVALARPRRRGTPEFAQLEGVLLRRLLGGSAQRAA